MNQITLAKARTLKWPELWSLAALNAAVVISWIAYHEYQPKLVQKFSLDDLSTFLIIAKAAVLVLIPPVAGYVADKAIQKGGRYFVVITVGVGITAMIFMIVASIIHSGPESRFSIFLPYMVILWLIAMNTFHSPANSMVKMFTPAKNLPIAMGLLILITELLYALEPVVVYIVDFFGATFTFIVGGILLAATGIIFQKVSSDEVLQRKNEILAEEVDENKRSSKFLWVLSAGLVLGLGHSYLINYVPLKISHNFRELLVGNWNGQYYASIFLAIAAVSAMPISLLATRVSTKLSLGVGSAGLILGIAMLMFAGSAIVFLTGGLLLAISFSLVSVSGLPFALSNLTMRQLTLGVGIFFSATELADSFFDIYYGLK